MLVSSKCIRSIITTAKFSPYYCKTPYTYFATKNKTPAQNIKAKAGVAPPDQVKLVFDDSNKALIFQHVNGDVQIMTDH